jgi:hypothetical protein
MKTAETEEQTEGLPDSLIWWLPVVVVGLFLLAFPTEPGPAPIRIGLETPHVDAVSTPPGEPLVIGTAVNPDPEARLRLNVTIVDENDRMTPATITVTWLNNEFPRPLFFNESSVEIPIPAGWTPVLVSVTKPGYLPVKRVIEARIDEDFSYEWLVRLVAVGEPA